MLLGHSGGKLRIFQKLCAVLMRKSPRRSAIKYSGHRRSVEKPRISDLPAVHCDANVRSEYFWDTNQPTEQSPRQKISSYHHNAQTLSKNAPRSSFGSFLSDFNQDILRYNFNSSISIFFSVIPFMPETINVLFPTELSFTQRMRPVNARR